MSIGLPVFNGARHLAGRLSGIKRQTLSDFELIVSDNASTDETPSILRHHLAGEPRARVIRQSPALSAADNFRYVLEAATTPYFVWAAHDDLWEPSYLERLVRILDSRPEVVLAFSRFDNIDGDGRTARTYATDWDEIWRRPKYQHLREFVLADPSGTQKANHIYGVMRRDVLMQSEELFAYDAYAGSDVMHLYSLLCRGDFAVDKDLLFHYRVRERTPPATRPAGAGVSYLWNRVFGARPGHDSNLLRALAKHHYYYSSMRGLILKVTPLPWRQRAALAAVFSAREAEGLAQFPLAAARELFGDRWSARRRP